MVQGFETRDNTDTPVRALVESANDHMWKKERAVEQYSLFFETKGFEPDQYFINKTL